MMKLVSSKNGCLHIEFPNRKEICMTMGRIAEFYESAHKNLRNKVFTLEEFIDTFTDENGVVNYYNFWSGFNISDKVFYDFMTKFSKHDVLTSREEKLLNFVNAKYKKKGKFYIIATMTGDIPTFDHELAHGMYYLNDEYRKKADKLVVELDNNIRLSMTKTLTNLGYASNVMKDELNAYLGTSDAAYMKKRFGLTKMKEHMKPFRELFGEYKND